MTRKGKLKLCWQLFFSFFKIGSFTFGGGFAMIPLIERDVVDKQRWMEYEDFVDMIAVTQSSPGPVAVNSAVFIGYKLAGMIGAVSASLGVILPSFLVILLFATILASQGHHVVLQKFFNGVRPAVVALIFGAGLNMSKKSIKGMPAYLVAGSSILLLLILDIHPILLIIMGAALGVFKTRMELRRAKEDSQ